MCTVLLPPDDNPIAVNKYIILKIQIQREKTHITPTNAPFYNLFVLSFTQLLHVSALSRHLQGADTKIYFTCTAIKYVTISVQVLWYQHL